MTKQALESDNATRQVGTEEEALVRSALDEAYFRWADADALSPLTREHMARQIACALFGSDTQ